MAAAVQSGIPHKVSVEGEAKEGFAFLTRLINGVHATTALLPKQHAEHLPHPLVHCTRWQLQPVESITFFTFSIFIFFVFAFVIFFIFFIAGAAFFGADGAVFFAAAAAFFGADNGVFFCVFTAVSTLIESRMSELVTADVSILLARDSRRCADTWPRGERERRVEESNIS